MEFLLKKWASFVVRWPLIVIGLWIVLIAVAWVLGPSINTVAATQKNTSSLPASALSSQADQVYAQKFSGSLASLNQETDLLLLTDPHGITSQDVALAEKIESWLTSTRPMHFLSVKGPDGQTPVQSFESNDHQALRMTLTWDTTNTTVVSNSLPAIYTYLSQQHLPSGGFLGITGSTPITYDLSSSILSTGGSGGLRIASTLGLLIVLLILGLVYRSPLAVVVPLIAVGLAVALAIPLIALVGQTFGIVVATFSLQYVAFVLLGAGTNYGVFMLSRYKEEIRRGALNDKATRRAALERTVERVGESIISSASTVIVATAIMGFAQLYELRVTGPAIAIGVACLLLAGLTLLPALMALCGKALFWPAQPKAGTLTDTNASRKGFWASAGRLVTTHPVVIALVTTIVLLPLAISTIMIVPSFDDLKALPASSPSVRTFTTYQAHFNDSALARVIISDPGHDLRQAEYSPLLTQITASVSRLEHVAHVQSPLTALQQTQQSGFATDGSAALLAVSLNVDPSSTEARQAIDTIYTAVNNAKNGTTLSAAQVLISGQSSAVHDEAIQFNNDFIFVVILVCIAIYIILALLVRSVTAPLYLLATIALSALTAVGITNLIFNVGLGEPLFSIVPIFAFVFLVSLGEDFNILTIARIREEVQKLGHKQGIATAIALTGGTVSSCGLVMAASFSRLTTNAIVEIAELGFTVMVGIMLDTFIVRPLLVPAIVTLLGSWNWVWPGRHKSIQVPSASPETQQSDSPIAEPGTTAELAMQALNID